MESVVVGRYTWIPWQSTDAIAVLSQSASPLDPSSNAMGGESRQYLIGLCLDAFVPFPVQAKNQFKLHFSKRRAAGLITELHTVKMAGDKLPSVHSLDKPEDLKTLLREDAGNDCLSCRIVGELRLRGDRLFLFLFLSQ